MQCKPWEGPGFNSQLIHSFCLFASKYNTTGSVAYTSHSLTSHKSLVTRSCSHLRFIYYYFYHGSVIGCGCMRSELSLRGTKYESMSTASMAEKISGTQNTEIGNLGSQIRFHHRGLGCAFSRLICGDPWSQFRYGSGPLVTALNGEMGHSVLRSRKQLTRKEQFRQTKLKYNRDNGGYYSVRRGSIEGFLVRQFPNPPVSIYRRSHQRFRFVLHPEGVTSGECRNPGRQLRK